MLFIALFAQVFLTRETKFVTTLATSAEVDDNSFGSGPEQIVEGAEYGNDKYEVGSKGSADGMKVALLDGAGGEGKKGKKGGSYGTMNE